MRIVFSCAAFLFALAPFIAHGMDQAEFESRARSMLSRPHLALRLQDLIQEAAPHAQGDPLYLSRLHGYKSHAFWLRRQHAQAEAEARRALSYDSNTDSGFFFLSDALYGQGKNDEAYKACLMGSERRPKQDVPEARSRCRAEYLDRLSLTPEAALLTAAAKRLATGQEVLLRGRIHSLAENTITFTAQQGTIECRLAPKKNTMNLLPMTAGEVGKHSKQTYGLQPGELITLLGKVRYARMDQIRLESCTLVPH